MIDSKISQNTPHRTFLPQPSRCDDGMVCSATRAQFSAARQRHERCHLTICTKCFTCALYLHADAPGRLLHVLTPLTALAPREATAHPCWRVRQTRSGCMGADGLKDRAIRRQDSPAYPKTKTKAQKRQQAARVVMQRGVGEKGEP